MTTLLTADDVAAMLGVSRDWVYSEVRAARIPHLRLGRSVRFRAETIEGWLADLEAGTMGPSSTRPRAGDTAGASPDRKVSP